MSASKSFLLSVSERIYNAHSSELDQVLIVVPSTRAGRFIFNHLKTFINNKVSWLPTCLGISQLVQNLSESELLDRLELTLTLFNTHKLFNPADSLEGFLKWGGTALSDFNEIENYLLEGERIFSDLRDIKEIEEWSFNDENLSKDQTQFAEFWTYLGKLKTAFDQQLKSDKKGYSGLLIREAISALENGLNMSQWKKIYFVGLNAISTSEKELINSLRAQGLAEVISDSDHYYHDAKIQEAGLFMRRQEDFFRIRHQLTDGFKHKKNINFIKANTTLGMPSVAANLISADTEETALILGDEKLLEPLLSAVHPDVKEANITMGYPVADGIVWRGLSKVVKLKMQLASKGKAPLEALEELANDPFISTLIKYPKEFRQNCEAFRLENRVWLNQEEVTGTVEEANPKTPSLELAACVKSAQTTDFIEALNALLELAFKLYPNQVDFIKEQTAIIHRFLQRISAKVSQVPELNHIQNLGYFIDQLITNEKVPFVGEPYGGVQIMGLLEARALDFKHVIFCGATDALMPAISADNSFIPFELKIYYGLPTHREKEAVFAYSFYRLCQRAEHIDFIYVETEDGLVANEKSRFLSQIEFELPKYSPTQITYKKAQSVTNSQLLAPLEIAKTEAHLQRIKDFLTRGVSASAINTFLTCPADFYYKYVVGLKEPDKLDEVVHPSITGSILHDTLEELYTPYLKKVLTKEVLLAIKKESVNVLDRHVDEWNLTKLMSSGENKLEYIVMKEKLLKFLSWELSEVNRFKEMGQVITLESLEQNYKSEVPGVQMPDGTPVVLSGYVDRIDRIGAQLRVIDYKSGGVKPGDVSLNKEFELDHKKGKALQLLMYGLLVRTLEPDYGQTLFTVGNISLKNISKGLINVKSDRKVVQMSTEVAATVSGALNQIFAKMLSAEEAFYHREEADYCDFCIKD
ncbi:MAG: PD-(D/E)XK nuclease family protein [Flavobacteriales bacterium]